MEILTASHSPANASSDGEVSIQFFGAAETVTGSRFLVSHGNIKVMVDCGMFQGEREVEKLNNAPFPFDIREISAVLLTHAHLDHCGALPILSKNGYEGPIYCSNYTRKIAEIVLLDSAHLQMQEAKFDEPHSHGEFGSHKHADHVVNTTPTQPLYNDKDVISLMQQFKAVNVRERIEIYPEVFATFYLSGHILGATFVHLEIGGKNILFTGDMGRGNHPILMGPDVPPAVKMDAVITESTYGATTHDTDLTHFSTQLNDAIARGGSILIPAFAVDRTEEILFEIRRLFISHEVKELPVFVDSPMAETVLNYYREALKLRGEDVRSEVADQLKGGDAFETGALHELYTTDESKMLNDYEGQCIIISASGMATGGRVTFHLENMLPDAKNTVLLVGYQGRGTRGLLLEQGADKVKIRGNWVPVNAHIGSAMNFSVHADQNELMSWLKKVVAPSEIFVVHGELESQQAMQKAISSEIKCEAIIPQLHNKYVI